MFCCFVYLLSSSYTRLCKITYLILILKEIPIRLKYFKLSTYVVYKLYYLNIGTIFTLSFIVKYFNEQ